MREEEPAGHLTKSLLFTGSWVNSPYHRTSRGTGVIFVPKSSFLLMWTPNSQLVVCVVTKSSPVTVKSNGFSDIVSQCNRLMALKKVSIRCVTQRSLSVILKGGSLPEGNTSVQSVFMFFIHHVFFCKHIFVKKKKHALKRTTLLYLLFNKSIICNLRLDGIIFVFWTFSC